MRLLYAIAPLLVAAKSRLASRLDDNALLRRAKAIDDWFAAPTNRTTPVAWTVRRKSDVQLGEKISSKAKTVYRGSMRGAPVIVKGKGRHAAQGDYGGDVLWEEMIYLEALRGEPGIVPLHGAWFSAGCVEINQCVGFTRQFFTKSFLGNDVAVLARSSGEELASPRHRAGVASMAWRTTR